MEHQSVRVVLGTAAKTRETAVKIHNSWEKPVDIRLLYRNRKIPQKGRVFWPAIAEKLKELMMSASGRVVCHARISAAATDDRMDLHAIEFRLRFAEYCLLTRDLTTSHPGCQNS